MTELFLFDLCLSVTFSLIFSKHVKHTLSYDFNSFISYLICIIIAFCFIIVSLDPTPNSYNYSH
jgi:hypothetical protein